MTKEVCEDEELISAENASFQNGKNKTFFPT
jgi:hypothetical protein